MTIAIRSATKSENRLEINELGQAKVESSVERAFAIAPHDTNNLANVTTGLFIGVDGDVKVDLSGVGTGIVFKNLAAGQFYPIRAKRVYATGTTATNIVGVY